MFQYLHLCMKYEQLMHVGEERTGNKLNLN